MKKRFRLPIASVNYTVTTNKRKPNCNGTLVQGYCYYKAKRISAYRNPNPVTFRATLWHEVFHALFYEMGRKDLADDEALVEGLAQAIMRIRLENGEL